MDPVEVTLRTFIPAQAIGVGGLYPTDFVNNGNARYFSTAEDASVKTSQSALLSFGAGGEPVLDESTAEPSRTGETELFNKSDASLSAIQSGLIFWRYDLKPGAVPVETDQLNPTSVATPSISVDDHAFSVDFHLSATNPLPPPVHVASIGPYSWDIFPPQSLIPEIDADVHLNVSQDAACNTSFVVSGTHDGFPAYEILINHRLVYAYDPVEANSDPLNLAPPEDVEIPPTSGSISPAMELLANGSFEDQPNLTDSGFVLFTSLPGWTTNPGSAALEVCADNYRGVGGSDGHWLDTQGSPGGIDISQTVDVGTGATAHLTARIAAGDFTSPSEHLEFIFDGTIVKDVSLLDFGILSPVLIPKNALNTFEDFTVDVTGQGGLDTLEIKSVGASSNYGFSLDNVSLITSGDFHLSQGPLGPGQLSSSLLSSFA